MIFEPSEDNDRELISAFCNELSKNESVNLKELHSPQAHNYSRDFILNKLSVSAYEVTFANDLYIDIFTTLFYHLKFTQFAQIISRFYTFPHQAQ
jgi:hypothetical protein